MIDTLRKSLKVVAAVSFLLGGVSFLFAQQEANQDSSFNRGYIGHRQNIQEQQGEPVSKKGVKKSPVEDPKNFTEMQKQARMYREQGFSVQGIGNLDMALVLYQKAVELDPRYAVAYNDLGVIYEAKGMIDRAEENYLKAIKINPDFLSAYSNLAFFYENKRDLEKAAYYWSKRVELGTIDDEWKEKARMRLEDIRAVLSPAPVELTREQEVVNLTRDLACRPKPEAPKSKAKISKNTESAQLFKNAKESYARKDYAEAFKEALDALQLDPTNKNIEKFIEKVQNEALTR